VGYAPCPESLQISGMPVPRPAVSISWREGRFFDLWMLVHFGSGVAGGFSNVFFGLSPLGVYIVATTMMVLWELGEYLMGVREAISNCLLDIVVGLAGVQLALWIAAPLPRRGRVIAFIVSFGLALVLGTLGMIAFRRRAYQQTNP
jgi:hypothetical protein